MNQSEKLKQHKTQVIAKDILVRFEKEQLDVFEGFLVLCLVIKSIGKALNMGPKVTVGLIQRTLIRLAQSSKTRERSDKIWVPRGVGLE